MENLNECVDEEEEEGGSRARLLGTVNEMATLNCSNIKPATFVKALENMEILAPVEVW